MFLHTLDEELQGGTMIPRACVDFGACCQAEHKLLVSTHNYKFSQLHFYKNDQTTVKMRFKSSIKGINQFTSIVRARLLR